MYDWVNTGINRVIQFLSQQNSIIEYKKNIYKKNVLLHLSSLCQEIYCRCGHLGSSTNMPSLVDLVLTVTVLI